MSNELADLLKTYNDKILAMEARIAFLEKLEASTSGSPPPDAVLYTPQVESGARQLVARTNIGAGTGDMPLVSPAVLDNLVLQNADGTLKDAGYGVEQSTPVTTSVVRRAAGGTIGNIVGGAGVDSVNAQSLTGRGVNAQSGSGVGVEALSDSGTGARSTTNSGTYHHEFGLNTSAIARTSGVLTFLGGSAAANRAAQRTELGATTVGSNLFTAANPSAVTYIRVNADNTVSFLTAAQMQTALSYVTTNTSQTITAAGTKTWQGAQTFHGGIDAGYVGSTSLVARRINNILIPRAPDFTNLIFGNYLDEAALWGERPRILDSIAYSTTPTTFGFGTIQQIPFRDDSSAVVWNTGTPFPIQITIDSTTYPISANGNGTYQVGITFRSSGVTVTNIQVEVWDGSAYQSVHNAAPGNNGFQTNGFGYWISPLFLSFAGVSFDIQRLRITINGNNGEIANNFRIQNIQLYHATATWDTFTKERLALVRQRATILPFHAESDGTITLTDQALAEQFLSNSSRNITKFDLTQYTQCRLITRVTTGSASANSPRLRVRYNTTFSTTVGDYSDIGTSEVSTSLTSTGVIDSGWVNLAAGALADVFITVTQLGGDGAADPAYGMVMVHFR
jgi:hypothetical protein